MLRSLLGAALAAVALLFCAHRAHAQCIGSENCLPAGHLYTPWGFQKSSSLGSAVGLPSITPGAIFAYLTPEGQAIRWTAPGALPCDPYASAPTADTGNIVYAGSQVLFQIPLSCIRIIGVADGASIGVQYVK